MRPFVLSVSQALECFAEFVHMSARMCTQMSNGGDY